MRRKKPFFSLNVVHFRFDFIVNAPLVCSFFFSCTKNYWLCLLFSIVVFFYFSYIVFSLVFFFLILFQFDNNYSQWWMFMWIDSVLIVVIVVWTVWMPPFIGFLFFVYIFQCIDNCIHRFFISQNGQQLNTAHRLPVWCTVFGVHWPLDSISIFFSPLFSI